MGFGPFNIVRPRVISSEAFLSAASSPSNQLTARVVGPAPAEAFQRGVTYALIKLEASAPVELQVPNYAEPPVWTTRLTLSSYDRDRVPLMFNDGIRIVAGAGVTVNAIVVTV